MLKHVRVIGVRQKYFGNLVVILWRLGRFPKGGFLEKSLVISERSCRFESGNTSIFETYLLSIDIFASVIALMSREHWPSNWDCEIDRKFYVRKLSITQALPLRKILNYRKARVE